MLNCACVCEMVVIFVFGQGVVLNCECVCLRGGAGMRKCAVFWVFLNRFRFFCNRCMCVYARCDNTCLFACCC